MVRKSRLKNESEMPMAPMVDVVFLLLVFFIFTYQVRVLERYYWVGIPPSRRGAVTEGKPVMVRLEATAGGELAAIVSDSQRWSTLDEFVWEMQRRFQAPGSARPILVEPAGILKYEHVVAVSMIIRQNGWQLSLLAHEPGRG